MWFLTNSGNTKFIKSAIGAVTVTNSDGTVNVHLCSGTIFTVIKEESDTFITWFEQDSE